MPSAKKPQKSTRSKTSGGDAQSKRSKAKLSAKRTAVSTKRGPAPRASRTAKGAAATRKSAATRVTSKAAATRATAAKRAAVAKATARSKAARPAAAKTGAARAGVRPKTTRAAKTAAAAVRRARVQAASKSARRTAAQAHSVKTKVSTRTTPKAVTKPAAKAPVRVAQTAARKPAKAATPAVSAPKEVAAQLTAEVVKPVTKVATSAPGAAAKIVAALKAAAQAAKPVAVSKPAAGRPPAVPEEANKGGTIPVMQKAQKKTDLAVPPTAVAPAGRPVAPVAPILAAAPQRPEAGAGQPTPFAPKVAEKLVPKPTKPTGNRHGFKTSEFIVYPAHGVGQITAIEEQEVAGFKLELFVISFIKDKMILKVPTPKVASVGMRKLAEAPVVARALETLTGRARIKRTMWSRRAQEYEAKINSGDLIAIAEVVRDLYRSDAQPEQSYSERQLYEAAVDRMGREIGAVNKLTETESLKLIEANLQKGPRRGKAEEAEEIDSEDGDIEEAA